MGKIRYEKGNFAIVPNIDEIMVLSESGLKVYIALCKHADDYGGCFPSTAAIAELTGLSNSGARKGLYEIRDRGFVEITKRKRPNGSTASNHYQLLIVTTSQVGVTAVTGDPTQPGHPLTIPIEQPLLRNGADALVDNSKELPISTKEKKEDEVLKNFYLVLKKYGLPVLNHKHIPGWADKLRDTHGQKVALAYLVRLQQRDLREERKKQEFVPTLNRPMDVLEKSAKIIQYFTNTKPVDSSKNGAGTRTASQNNQDSIDAAREFRLKHGGKY